VLSYQAYDRAQFGIAATLLIVAMITLGGLAWSMFVTTRSR